MPSRAVESHPSPGGLHLAVTEELPLLARIVCVGDALNDHRALAANHRHIVLNNGSHERVVDGAYS